MYGLQDPETVLKMMEERYGKIHFNRMDGCFLSPFCFISSLLADGLRLTRLTSWLG